MDIHISSLPPEIVILVFLFLFILLSHKKPDFAALLFPIVLPFYLIKLRIINLPTNLFEILVIIFLVINWRLVWRGFQMLWSNVFVVRPFTNVGSDLRSEPENSRNLGSSLRLEPTKKGGDELSPPYEGGEREGVYIGKYFLFAIFFLLFSTIISAIFAINLRAALGAAKSWFFLPVLLFFAMMPLLRSPKYRLKFLYSFALSGIVVAIINLPFVFANLYAYDGRLAGIYLSPNHLAMALVSGIIALLIQKSRIKNQNDNSKLKIGFYFVLILELITLYLTYSYGTWLALIIVSSPIVILNLFQDLQNKVGSELNSEPNYSRNFGSRFNLEPNRNNNKGLYVKLLMPLLIIAVLVFSQLSNPKLQHIINGDYYSSLHSRVMIWQSALLVSRDHWLTGVGAGNFQQVYLDYQNRFSEPYIEWAVPMPHNIFLAFQTQLGIIGLISFISIVILTFYRLSNHQHTSPFSPPYQGGDEPVLPLRRGGARVSEGRGVKTVDKHVANRGWRIADPLSLFALSYLTYLILHGLIDTPYFKNDLAILFWLSIAIIWADKGGKYYVTLPKPGDN